MESNFKVGAQPTQQDHIEYHLNEVKNLQPLIKILRHF